MNPETEMTQPEALLQVARSLAERSHDGVFSWAELCVEAHRVFPEKFMLQGFPEYMDTNLISTSIYGKRGLVALKLLERVGPKFYRIGQAQQEAGAA